jgi:hypothetical protein
MQKQISGSVKDHIKEVMNMALSTKRAKIVVPKTMLRIYMLELKLMGVLVTVENENELYIDWTDEGKALESGRRGSSERSLRSGALLQEKKRKDK